MSARELAVQINDERIGTLRESNDLWSFEYTEEWSKSPQGFDLSPALNRAQPLHADGASDRPVQWYFDNLLPEEGMRTVLAKEAKLSEEDAFGLLGYFGAESAGSLVLLDPTGARVVERGLKPLPSPELSRRIRNLSRAGSIANSRYPVKRRLLIGSMMVMSLAACSWWGHKRHAPPEPTEIIVNGAPVESVVFVDGTQAAPPVEHGRSGQILEVSAGQHRVEVRVGDRVVYREEVYVASGGRYMVSVLSGWNR